MNFAYFLWRSLKKMCETVKRSVVNPEQHLFHHGLIKLLIVTELKARKNTWNNFVAGNLSSPTSGRKTRGPTVSTRIRRSLSHTGKKRKVKVIGEVSFLEPEFKKMTRSMTSKNPNLDNPFPEFQMKIYIDTDDDIEGGSSAIVYVLVNLRKELPPCFSQSSSPPPNPTRLGSPEIISPKKFIKLQTKNAHLKENLHEYEVLYRFLKIENTTLKGHFLNIELRSLICVHKWINFILRPIHSALNIGSFSQDSIVGIRRLTYF
jgi:hypothetical protein